MKIFNRHSLKLDKNMPLKTIQNNRLSRLTKAFAISLSLSVIMLSGCTSLTPYKAPLTQGNVMKQDAISDLQEGLNKDQVRILLGPPLARHPFKPNHWEYVFYSNNAELHSDSAKRLSIQFDEDNLLKTWQVINQSVEVENRGFWSTLF